MASPFHALTHPRKLSVALFGPPGAGKTYTALAVASRCARRIAVVDTDHGASAWYHAAFPHDTACLAPPYAPERFLTLLQEAVQAGYDALIFDSLSAEWDEPGGCLDLIREIAAKDPAHNTWAAWKAVAPRHDALFHALNAAPITVFATFRQKEPTELVKQPGHDGRPRSQVLRRDPIPVTRRTADFGYAFDLVLRLDAQHHGTAVKSRLPWWPVGTTLPCDAACWDRLAQTVSPATEVPAP